MKILFSPSETKTKGGSGLSLKKDDLIFPELYQKRLEIIDRYIDFVSTANDNELSKFFGLKDPKQFEDLKVDIKKAPTKKAILRYSGVAYDYLKYEELDSNTQKYIDDNTIIFSNLFGAIKADTPLPEYKIKQGETIGGFKTEDFYKEHFTDALNEILKDEIYLDLRAGFYNKFYKPSSLYMTLKFLKNGKVVSHWAKAYRGIVLREMAKAKIKNYEEFLDFKIDGLIVKEIVETKIKKEVIFDLV
ncbi:MAG: YaaA family protein [Campylobacterales bacterium]|nr:YaaA family protein [Campylobacterales bacterium]